MKRWVEAQAGDGRYANSSDYVRDLIRRDQERRERVAELQTLVDEALADGIDPRSPEEIMTEIRERVRRKHALHAG